MEIDGGPWASAKLGAEDTIDTWRQWRYEWQAPPVPTRSPCARRTAMARADARSIAPPFPSGATGLHQIPVTVS